MTIPGPKIRAIEALLLDGWSVNAAAKQAGVSRWKVDQVKQGLRREVEDMKAASERRVGGPVPYERLCAEAQRAWDDFGFFRRRYLGRVSTPWQEHAGYRVKDLLESRQKEYLVVNCPPGSGKSTLFTHDIPAWLTVRNRSIRGLMGSYGERVAAAYTSRLRNTLSRTSPIAAKTDELEKGLAFDADAALAGDYGGFKPEVQDIWRREQFTVSQFGETLSDEKESTWTAFGKDSGSLGWRVNFINWDDLFTVRMRTPEVIADLKEWWDSEAEQRLEPFGLLVLQGQRLRADDIYRYCLDKVLWTDELDAENDTPPKMYHHIVYKAHYDEWCRADQDPSVHKEAAKPYDPVNPAEGGCMLDPLRVPMREQQAAKASGRYQTVYQQEDADPSSLLVPREWIDGGVDSEGVDRPGCWDKDRATGDLPQLAGHSRIRYITVDPSPTMFWSIQDWVYVQADPKEPLGGDRFLIDHLRVKMQANDLLDWANDAQSWVGVLEEWVTRSQEQDFPVGYLILEKNAAQRWAMQYEHFRRWQSARGVQVIPHETTRNKSDPGLGIQATLPHAYMHGRVRLPGKGTNRVYVDQLVTEVTKWPEWSTDDCVMAQWFGEYNLPGLAQSGARVASVYSDIPTWMRDAERRVLSIAGQ